MKPGRISAMDHHPLDLRAAHPNVPEHAVIERMKLAHRRVAGHCRRRNGYHPRPCQGGPRRGRQMVARLRRPTRTQRVGDLGRVLNPVIIGAPQPQASQVEILHPDERDRRHALTPPVGPAQAALHCGGPDPPRNSRPEGTGWPIVTNIAFTLCAERNG